MTGTYYLSNLLQELKRAEDGGSDTASLEPGKIFERPADRIARMVREYYWDALTRRVDAKGLPAILSDDKTVTRDGKKYVYVPHDDTAALAYFTEYAGDHPALNVRVVRLPSRVTAEFVHSLDGRHGLLTLALKPAGTGYEGVPFVVPGGRFNEMYGWDSYFIALGLIHDGRVSLAKSIADNFVYEIARYGKILNANRTYYLTRSASFPNLPDPRCVRSAAEERHRPRCGFAVGLRPQSTSTRTSG